MTNSEKRVETCFTCGAMSEVEIDEDGTPTYRAIPGTAVRSGPRWTLNDVLQRLDRIEKQLNLLVAWTPRLAHDSLGHTYRISGDPKYLVPETPEEDLS